MFGMSSFCAFLFHHVLSVKELKLSKPLSKHIEQNGHDMVTKFVRTLIVCFKFHFSHQRKHFEETLWFDAKRIFIVKSLK